MIARKAQEEVLRLMANFPLVGILGPRQVGKTTLVKALQSHLQGDSLYLDLEDFRDQQRIGEDPLLFLEQYADRCVILDEIQRRPDLFPALRSVIDRNKRPGRFVVLGSASPALLARSGESLAGRIAYVELTGISVEEAQGAGIPLLRHWFRGGFPDPLLHPSESFVGDWYRAFIRSYVDVDLSGLGVSVKPGALGRFLRVLATLNGSVLNVESLSRTVDLRSGLIRDYLDILEGAFVIRRLLPYHSNLGKRMVRSPKVYIRDSGLLHHLLYVHTEDGVHQHIAKGTSWEVYVLEQIIGRLAPEVQPFFYQTAHQAEVDLVLERGGRVVACIEIKLSNSPALSKGNHLAVADMQCERNFVLTYDSGSYLNGNWQVSDLAHIWPQLGKLGLLQSR